MRVFLSLMVFDMVFRGLAWSLNNWYDTAADLKMEVVPRRLPTPAEWSGEDPSGPTFAEGISSAGRFLLPWPRDATRARLHTPGDGARFAAAWLVTRLDACGRLVGIEQAWTMFSPDVAGRSNL